MISPPALIRCRCTRPKQRRGGPAHAASAAPEPPASTSVGLLGSTTVAMPRGDSAGVAPSTVRVMGRRLLVSRKIGVDAAAAASLAGHAGIAHNHHDYRLGVSVGRTWTRSGDTM